MVGLVQGLETNGFGLFAATVPGSHWGNWRSLTRCDCKVRSSDTGDKSTEKGSGGLRCRGEGKGSSEGVALLQGPRTRCGCKVSGGGNGV